MKSITLSDGRLVQIREAVTDDAANIINYLDKIAAETDYLTFGPGELRISEKEQKTFIRRCLDDPRRVLYVAETDEEIVGAVDFRPGERPRVSHAGEFGVSVLKRFWGFGIGTELVRTLLTWAEQSGHVRKLNLKVRSDHSAAIHVYRKLGFADEGRIAREFFVEGRFFDALCMGKCID
ncbi:MAG: GNAT family protein [Bacillota bacterium]|nr:GNAT family protein [Bacillota bacterium]MDW7683679.1 GNAT family protein [Bacillota bacterium]